MRPVVNFQPFKRSNRRPEAGDLFAVKMPTDQFVFGRVIRASPPVGEAPMPEAYLLYVYSWTSASPTAEVQKLTPANLLIPPLWTNRKGWTLGYFLTLGQSPLTDRDLLARHCFKLGMPRFGYHYVDHVGRFLREAHEPCGLWGLVSYRWMDDRISEALGIPVAPMTDQDMEDLRPPPSRR